jgi:hypothetical protein
LKNTFGKGSSRSQRGSELVHLAKVKGRLM